jgi:hypothetical protein
MIDNAMDYNGTSVGNCSAPGTGGDCWLAFGNVTLDNRENSASITFSFPSTVIMIDAGLYLSCVEPNGTGLSEIFTLHEDFGACGVSDRFTMSAKENLTACDNGAWWVLIKECMLFLLIHFGF